MTCAKRVQLRAGTITQRGPPISIGAAKCPQSTTQCQKNCAYVGPPTNGRAERNQAALFARSSCEPPARRSPIGRQDREPRTCRAQPPYCVTRQTNRNGRSGAPRSGEPGTHNHDREYGFRARALRTRPGMGHNPYDAVVISGSALRRCAMKAGRHSRATSAAC